jgi:hypothetical protein
MIENVKECCWLLSLCLTFEGFGIIPRLLYTKSEQAYNKTETQNGIYCCTSFCTPSLPRSITCCSFLFLSKLRTQFSISYTGRRSFIPATMFSLPDRTYFDSVWHIRHCIREFREYIFSARMKQLPKPLRWFSVLLILWYIMFV